MSLGALAGTQHLHAGTNGLHDRAASDRIDVIHHHAIEGRALGGLGKARQRFIGRRPFVFEQRRITLRPITGRRTQTRIAPGLAHIINRISHSLLQIGMDDVEIGFQHIDERNVETILPDAGRTAGFDAVFMPGAIGREHEIIGAERHLVTVDDRISARAFHDEAQRRSGMRVGGSDFARMHDLQAGIEPADGGGIILASGIVEIDDATASFFRRDQFDRTQDVFA